MNRKPLLTVFALALAAILGAGAAEAHLRPSTDLLLPYFEVDLGAGGMTALFAITNSSEQPVSAVATIYTNWGIPVLDVPLAFGPRQVRSTNLRDWIAGGKLPAGTLPASQLAVLQANLTGGRSPKDALYYSTAVAAGRAAGYVIIRVASQAAPRPAVLWGDTFSVDSGDEVAWGGPLVDISSGVGCPDLCNRHGLRFLSGAAFDGGTELIVWTPRQGQPSADSYYAEGDFVQGNASLYDEAGQGAGAQAMSLLPVERIAIADLGATAPFGWIDLSLETGAWVGVRHDSHKRYAIALETDCLPPIPPKSSGLALRKLTNGSHDDVPPGALLAVGSPVTWSYVVRNTGQVPLTGVAVSDDRGVTVACPKTTLDPGEEMICTGAGTAVACQYHNVGTAVATPPDGPQLVAQDDGYYLGDAGAKIALALSTNGQRTAAPGPEVKAGSTVTWTYLVTNAGRAALANVAVHDDHGVAVSCPRTTLAPGASMTCTATGTAAAGSYHNVGTATAAGPCGSMQASDDGYYHTQNDPPPPHLRIEKRTNGQHVAAAPGPSIPVGASVTWTYVVENDGGVALSNVKVTDDRGVLVSCPKSSLAPGETMTCTGYGTAVACQYSNTGSVCGTAPSGASLSAHDMSWYFGVAHPAIAIEKYTNGQRVAAAPGPTLAVGSAVTWTYEVANTGDVPLANVHVADDQHVAVACPKSTLAAGETMTCSAHGTTVAGQYKNIGTATGAPPCGNAVSASDSSYYYGQGGSGTQGCSPGYWKNHPGSWPPTGYSTGQTVASVFSQASRYPSAGSATLLEALSFSGGPSVEDTARLLAHHGVAALLNAADSRIDYPLLQADVVSQVNAALASGDSGAMTALASRLDTDNNLGCPLN